MSNLETMQVKLDNLDSTDARAIYVNYMLGAIAESISHVEWNEALERADAAMQRMADAAMQRMIERRQIGLTIA